MIRAKVWPGIAAFILLIVLSGCAVSPEPFEYRADNELKPGPGLFSGENGVFTIYRKPAAPEADPDKKQ